MVADQHRGVVAPLRVRRGLATAQRRLVHDVVVDQRRRVEQLHAAGQADGPRAAIPRQTRGQQEENRTQPLAARAGDVAAHLLDEAHGRRDLVTDLGFDFGEIVAD